MRSDKRKEATLTIGYTPEGKQLQKHFYGKTIAEARKKRDEYKRRLDAGMMVADITLSEWIDRYREAYKAKDDNCMVERLRRALGTRRVLDISEMDLQRELNSVAHMSQSYIAKYSGLIKRVFMRARTNRIIIFDPAENLIVPAGTRGTHRALERWEINAIMDNWQLYHAGRWAMLMLLCGLRRGEMAALDWADVDMEGRTILIHRAAVMRDAQTIIKASTKTRAGMRRLPICEPLYQMLAQTPPQARVGLVCTASRGQTITGTAANRNWTTYCRAITRTLNGKKPFYTHANADKDGIVFSCRMHDLRHTFATMLYDAHVDVKAAQYYLGHSNIQITLNLYTHLSQERENAARANLVDFLDGYKPHLDGQSPDNRQPLLQM